MRAVFLFRFCRTGGINLFFTCAAWWDSFVGHAPVAVAGAMPPALLPTERWTVLSRMRTCYERQATFIHSISPVQERLSGAAEGGMCDIGLAIGGIVRRPSKKDVVPSSESPSPWSLPQPTTHQMIHIKAQPVDAACTRYG